MVGTQKCVFCGKDIEPGTGMAFVRTKDGLVQWFCSKKCKTSVLKRGLRVRDTKWAAGYEKGGKVSQKIGKATQKSGKATPKNGKATR